LNLVKRALGQGLGEPTRATNPRGVVQHQKVADDLTHATDDIHRDGADEVLLAGREGDGLGGGVSEGGRELLDLTDREAVDVHASLLCLNVIFIFVPQYKI